jgi:cytochrome c553
MGEVWRTLLSLAVIVLVPVGAGAQSGETIYQAGCAACHTNPPYETIPRVGVLRLLGADAIVDALTSGAMRLQGEALTGAQKVHVAEYIAGSPVSERVAKPLAQRLVGLTAGRSCPVTFCSTASAPIPSMRMSGP